MISGSNIDPNVTLGNMINAINHRGPDDKRGMV